MTEIKRNLVYLTENICNMSMVLVHLIQEDIISETESKEIESEKTSFKQNKEMLLLVLKKDWDKNKLKFLEILRKTSNGHCADKIEELIKRDTDDTNEDGAGKIGKSNDGVSETFSQQKQEILKEETLKGSKNVHKSRRSENATKRLQLLEKNPYNLAIALLHNGELKESLKIFEKLLAKVITSNIKTNRSAQKATLKLLKYVTRNISTEFEDAKRIGENESPSEAQILPILLNLLLRLGKYEEAKKIVEKTASLNHILKILSITNIPSYYLEVNGIDIDLELSGQETEIYIADSSLDISLLPPSVQKLSLFRAQVLASGEIDLPNLRYLELGGMPSSSLSTFQTSQLTHINITGMMEVNVDIFPESVKTVHLFNEEPPTRVIGGEKNLHKLSLESCSFEQVEQVLSHLHPKQLFIYAYPGYEPKDLISVINKPIGTIAVGRVKWGWQLFSFTSLSKHVDKKSDFYLFEGGRGKAIDGWTKFRELSKGKI